MINGYVIDWSTVAAFIAAGVALYAARNSSKDASIATATIAIQQIAIIRHERLIALENAVSKFASLASGLTKTDLGEGYIRRDEFAELREYSAKINLLLPNDDPDAELLKLIMADEIGIASHKEKEEIAGQHLYTVANRILARQLNNIENELRRFDAKNK